jgi:hypothetical protein
LILERPPSPAEIPKGTIRPLPGHHFEQVESEPPPQIDPLKIKIERVDPDELQIINHPAKKARRLKPSKRLVREVITAIKEMQAEQSALSQNPTPHANFLYGPGPTMSNGRNVDKFHLQDLLRTVLHAQLLLQHALGIVIQHLHGDV